jgi:hypothetical protein
MCHRSYKKTGGYAVQQQRSNTEQDECKREEAEAAYRRGWTQGTEETARLVLQLVELGYKTREIKRLLAVYDDHFLHPWRHQGDLSKREGPPPFDINACQDILENTTGYDWIE